MDPAGLIKIANRTSTLAKLFADEIKKAGFKILSDHFFDTVTIITKNKTDEIYQNAQREGINLRKVDKDNLSVAFDEAKKLNDVNILLKIFGISKTINKM